MNYIKFRNLKFLKDAVRQPYTTLGGYELFAITRDGACICMDCVRDNWKTVCQESAVPGWEGCGWSVSDVDAACNVDGPIYCDHCSKAIVEDEA